MQIKYIDFYTMKWTKNHFGTNCVLINMRNDVQYNTQTQSIQREGYGTIRVFSIEDISEYCHSSVDVSIITMEKIKVSSLLYTR